LSRLSFSRAFTQATREIVVTDSLLRTDDQGILGTPWFGSRSIFFSRLS
jgi:hypothetical protein